MSATKAIIGGTILSVMGIACIVGGVAVGGFPDWHELKPNHEATEDTQRVELSSSSYTFEFDAADVKFHKTTEAKSYVDYKLASYSTIEATDSSFKTIQKHSVWFFGLNLAYNVVDVYISEAELDKINIELNAGNIEINDDINTKEFVFEGNAGNVTITNLTSNKADIELNAGNIEIHNSKIKALEFNVNAGNLDAEIAYPEDYYTIELEEAVGNLDVSPNNKKAQAGTESGYSLKGDVNAGNASFVFIG